MKKIKALPAVLLALCLLMSGCGNASGSSLPEGESETDGTEEPAAVSASPSTDETEGEEDMTADVIEEAKELTLSEQAEAIRNELWTAYCEKERAGETRISEDKKNAISMDGVTMKYGIKTVGKADENGLYPLYIALHGGGSDETGKINDDQWRQMASYYLGGVKNGVYVNPRAVRDTWDCHSNPESYPIYDRLIENMILFRNVDPNRVYILGFSAGGDGVYQITPRMTDRFAAANMSAGHPNGVKLESLYNMPLQLQVGIDDSAYNRNKVTAEYDYLLEKLGKKYGGGYIHKTNIHIGHAHNFADYDDAKHEIVDDVSAFFRNKDYGTAKEVTSALRFLDQYVRDPLPDTVVWNLGVRASMRGTDSFFWLSAPKTVSSGIVTARADREANSVTIETDKVSGGSLSVLLSARMFDFTKPVTIVLDGESREVTPEIRREIMEETLAERGDPEWIFEDKIDLASLFGEN